MENNVPPTFLTSDWTKKINMRQTNRRKWPNIMFVHTGFPKEYETRGLMGQLRLVCHCGLRRESRGLGLQRESRQFRKTRMSKRVNKLMRGHPETMGHRGEWNTHTCLDAPCRPHLIHMCWVNMQTLPSWSRFSHLIPSGREGGGAKVPSESFVS